MHVEQGCVIMKPITAEWLIGCLRAKFSDLDTGDPVYRKSLQNLNDVLGQIQGQQCFREEPFLYTDGSNGKEQLGEVLFNNQNQNFSIHDVSKFVYDHG